MGSFSARLSLVLLWDLSWWACVIICRYIWIIFSSCDLFADEATTLFRATTLASTLMEQYMKATATPFVHHALKDTILKIMESKQSCEVQNLFHCKGLLKASTCSSQTAEIQYSRRNFVQKISSFCSLFWVFQPFLVTTPWENFSSPSHKTYYVIGQKFVDLFINAESAQMLRFASATHSQTPTVVPRSRHL